MIIERNGINEARFSDDRRFRYQLTWFVNRALHVRPLSYRSLAFVMLNPSTADAFKLDPTVKRCFFWAHRWGFDAVQVVNLHAFRSPHPRVLIAEHAAARSTGADATNLAHILAVAEHSDLVIPAWGNGGLDHRLGCQGRVVLEELRSQEIELHRLGTTKSGAPKHPLARGKSRIPDNVTPELWTP